MSLTKTILNYSDKRFTDFRTLLKELFPTPKFHGIESIKVEPQTKNYGLVGTAFDYLLRFSLERKYKTLVHSSTWVAEEALRHFKEGVIFYTPDEINSVNIGTIIEERNIEYKKVNNKFEKCKSIYNEFINSQIDINDDLLESCFFLSRLDFVRKIPSNYNYKISFEPENVKDLSDLRQLINQCNLDQFCPKEKIILNPTFGEGSILVSGADADLIIDDLLIDIKTTIEYKLDRSFFNQLIGYYLLYLIGGIDNHKDSIINKLGIYFSRYDYLWTLPIKEIGSDEDFNKAVIKLKSTIKSK